MATKLDAPKWIQDGKDMIPQAEAELAAGNYGMAAHLANRAADTFVKGICLKVTGNELTGNSLAANCRQTSHFHKKLMTVFADCAQVDGFFVPEGQAPKAVTKEAAEKAIAQAKKVMTTE